MRPGRIILALAVSLMLPGATLSAQINTDRMMNVGRTALYFDDYVLSIRYFNQVIGVKPYLYEPYFYRAVAKLSLEDFRGAEKDCDNSISRNPFIVDSYQVRGLAKVYQKKYDSAISDFRKGLSLDPENRALRHNLILCLSRLDSLDDAQLAADTLLMSAPKYTGAMAMKSSLCWAQGDTAASLEWISRALSIDKYDVDLLNQRAVLYSKMEMYDQAEPDLDKSVYLDPGNAQTYEIRAMVRYCTDNLNGALADYDMAIRLDPASVTAHYNRGNLRAQIADDNRAILDFDFVIEAEPDNMMAIFNRGILRYQTGDLTGAEQDISKVIDEYPQFVYGYQLRSEVREKLGNRRGAEEDAMVVIREQTRRFNRAMGYADDGGDDSAEGQGKTRTANDRNVVNYRKIIVDDNLENSTGFSSEYRGKVQNRNVEVRYMAAYRLTYYSTVGESGGAVHNSRFLENQNDGKWLMSDLNIDCRDLTLSEERIHSLFDDIDRLTSLLDQDPENPRYSLARALDFCLLQDYNSASGDIDAAVSHGGDIWMTWFCRSQIMSRILEARNAEQEMEQQRAGQDRNAALADPAYGQVISDLTHVIEMQPEFQFAWYNRGTFNAMTGDLHAALVDLDRAIELDPTLAEAWYNRGLVLVFLGRMDEAFDDLSKAGELGLYSAYNIIKRFSSSE